MVVHRFLVWIRAHPRWGWAGLSAYAAAVTFPHENVQYLVNLLCIRFTHRRVYQASAVIGLVEAALLTWIVYRGLARQPSRRIVTAFWILTIVLIWGTCRSFTANNTELVHYPQYVPEGMLLLALTLSPVESIAWVTLFGGLDECFQYWDLMSGRHVPYDFNDVYMDLLGGAAGVLLAMAFLDCEPVLDSSWRRSLVRPGMAVIIGITAAGIILWSTGGMLLYEDKANSHYWFALSRDKPPEYWFRNPLFGPHKFHTLSPVEGPILILATLALYAVLDRRVRVLAKS
jgi:hypothetical protein